MVISSSSYAAVMNNGTGQSKILCVGGTATAFHYAGLAKQSNIIFACFVG